MSAQTDRPEDYSSINERELRDASARAALDGCCLYQLAGGGYLLTRAVPPIVRELPDLRSVRHVLDQLRGVPA